MTYFLLTIIIIIIFNLLIISKSDLTCNTSYNECFNCSVCGEISSNMCNCKWDTNSKNCLNVPEKSIYSDFYNNFDSCTDSNSNQIMQKYCGALALELDDKNEIEINIPNNGGIYGTQNLYCKYIFIPPDNEDSSYTIDYNTISNNYNHVYLYMTINIDDQIITGYLPKKAMTKSYDNIKELTLLLYFSESITAVPFSIRITKTISMAKRDLFFAIGLIFISCLLCILIVFCLSRKIKYNTRVRQRALLQLALARQRAVYNNTEEERVSSESNRSNEPNEEEENKKKIDILLKTILSPKKFLKEYGLKDGNTCTICIENFKEKKSKVSVTPCQHVFHFKCLSNWLVNNVMNPKCPNCNYNLLEEFNTKKVETIDVYRKNADNQDTNRPIINNQNQNINDNLDTIENRLIIRSINGRNRNRNNIESQSTGENLNRNNGNDNGGQGPQDIVIHNV